jgi:hypothetical protein
MDSVQTDAKDLLKVKNWKAQAPDRNEWRHIIGRPGPDLGCSAIGGGGIHIL